MSPLGYNTEVMYPPLAYEARRARFVNGLRSVAGTKPVICYLPHPRDVLTSIDPISGRVWTADATMAGQISGKGYGFARAFNGTSNFLATPSTANTSFGNGVTDTPYSVFTVLNITDTAGTRCILTKDSTSNREWELNITTVDTLQIANIDNSVPAVPFTNSTSTITQGSWHSYSGTYSAATGGATAASDMTVYQDGVALAPTASQDATYVAMEALASEVCVGAITSHTAGFFVGSIALAFVVGANLTAARHLGLHNACKSYFAI